MVTVVSNYCQLSQKQLSQTFAEKFTVTKGDAANLLI